MRAIAGRTSYVAGLPKEAGQAGGDPSPMTALGVFVSIKALLGGSVQGRTIAVQGVGAVGFNLCKLLSEEGAKLVVADVNKRQPPARRSARRRDRAGGPDPRRRRRRVLALRAGRWPQRAAPSPNSARRSSAARPTTSSPPKPTARASSRAASPTRRTTSSTPAASSTSRPNIWARRPMWLKPASAPSLRA